MALERACWACGVTADALRRRSKGHRPLVALPAAGLLVLTQAAPALARLGAATHVLDGGPNCWAKIDQELKRRAQAQSTNKGRQLAKLLGQALSPAHWRELWDKVKHSRWRSKSQQEQALQQAEAGFLASNGPGARYELRSGGKRDRGEDPDARQVGGCGAAGCWLAGRWLGAACRWLGAAGSHQLLAHQLPSHSCWMQVLDEGIAASTSTAMSSNGAPASPAPGLPFSPLRLPAIPEADAGRRAREP
jgi:hypothetical protein